MQLHLTIHEKLVDSVSIEKQKREDKKYLENKKMLLRHRNQKLLNQLRTYGEFYIDPVPDEPISLPLGVDE